MREMTTFIRVGEGCWRRDDERHENVLIDTAETPGWLAEADVDVRVQHSFGAEKLPDGLRAIVGYARIGAVQAVATVPFENRLRSSMGAGLRRSCRTNAMAAATAPPMDASVRAEVQPCSTPLVRL